MINSLCSTPFWDYNLTVQAKYPDLTICFQDTILLFLPSLYILLTAPLYIWYTHKYGKSHKPYSINFLAWIKILCAILLSVITIVDLIYRIKGGHGTGSSYGGRNALHVDIATILFPSLQIFSYGLVALLLYYERKNGIWSSGYTFNFWFLCACYLIVFIWSNSLALRKFGPSRVMPNYALYITQLFLVLIELILHSFNSINRTDPDSKRNRFRSKYGSGMLLSLHKSNKKSDHNLLKTEENIKLTEVSTNQKSVSKPCPVIFASFLSRITFWWFDKMAIYGSKHPLETSDLWTLGEEDTSNTLYPLFARHWYPYLERVKRKAFKKYLKNKHMDTQNVKTLDKCDKFQSSKEVDYYSTKLNGFHDQTARIDKNAKSDKSDNIYIISSNDRDAEFNKERAKLATGKLDGEVLKLYQEFESQAEIKPSLGYLLYRCFRWTIFQSFIYKLINDVCTFLNPEILKHLIAFVKQRNLSIWIGMFYAIAMLASAMFHTLILHKYFDIVFQLGLKMKTILICAIYRKALRLSSTARKSSTIGEIVNLMSVDTQKVTDVCTYASMLWSSPLQIAICMLFLWNILGPSVLAGLLVMVLLIPLNGIMANKIKKLQTNQMKLKDERIKVMNEVLNGIKVIKLYAWELSFEDKILNIRENEIRLLKKIALLNAVTSFVWSCAPFMVACVTFTTYLLSSPSHILDAQKAFVSLALFNILRFPLTMLPMIITYVVEANVALRRLRNFLLQDELDPDIVSREPRDKNDQKSFDIQIIDGNFSWDPYVPGETNADDAIDNDDKVDGKAGKATSSPKSHRNKKLLLKRLKFSKIKRRLSPHRKKDDGQLSRLDGKLQRSGASGEIRSKDDLELNAKSKAKLSVGQLTKERKSIPTHLSEDILSKRLEAEDVDTIDAGKLNGIEVNENSEENCKNIKLMENICHRVVLKDINLEIGKGELVAIVGTVGSGKSSLLSAILGEMKKVVSFSSVYQHYSNLAKDAALKHENEPLLTKTKHDQYEQVDETRLDVTQNPNASSSQVQSKIIVRGSIAYVAQQPWIRNASFRDNVVFDAPYPYDLNAYTLALQSCALLHDRDTVLPDSDDTEIGEKGVNLSGGQKQRLALARAVYRNCMTDIYLMDDPLSAVDVHVGRHIFDHVIGPTGVLKNKTRILVTNAIHLLPQVDRILVMKGGKIVEEGTYKQLSSQMSGVFADILRNYLSSIVDEQQTPTTPMSPHTIPLNMMNASPLIKDTPEADSIINPNPPEGLSRTLSSSKISSRKASTSSLLKILTPNSPEPVSLDIIEAVAASNNSITPIHENLNHFNEKDTDKGNNTDTTKKTNLKNLTGDKSTNHQLITKETSETGRVKLSVYFTYFKALKYYVFGPVLLMYGAYYGLSVAANFWLSAWSDDVPIIRNGTEYQNIPVRNKRLIVYATYGFLQAITIMLSTVTLALSMVYASRSLHMRLLKNILHSPMSFFDSTPLGRIVNRFSKDMDTLDNGLPPNIRSWITTFYGVLTTVLVICISTPWFLATVLPIAVIYFFILKFYIPTSRQLKRLESISRSPIYSHFQETLLGASTIRAFGVSGIFIAESHRLVDANQMCYYPSLISNRWLAVRLEIIGSFIVFLSALTVVLSRDHIKPGEAGLAISYALSVTQALNWLVRMTCEVETNIVAVERIDEYTNTPTEAPWVIESKRPPKNWPNVGTVEFDHYWLRYRPNLAPALRDVSFQAPGEQSVGIVGRTGAGKSSLTVALFRLAESDTIHPGPPSRILIDGIDIMELGLHDIRSKLTIIPQDPVLFSGTLRFNLDPFNEKSEEEVWDCLRNAHLYNFVSKLPNTLNYEIAESGDNLSLGQRQLVCLARAMLRNSKILVLDEATAAIDVETDELIQKTISQKFSHCTLLTIAHRLNTVIDYDRIMVLDRGQISEFDTPQNLLRNRDSEFYKMCLEAGLTSSKLPLKNESNNIF